MRSIRTAKMYFTSTAVVTTNWFDVIYLRVFCSTKHYKYFFLHRDKKLKNQKSLFKAIKKYILNCYFHQVVINILWTKCFQTRFSLEVHNTATKNSHLLKKNLSFISNHWFLNTARWYEYKNDTSEYHKPSTAQVFTALGFSHHNFLCAASWWSTRNGLWTDRYQFQGTFLPKTRLVIFWKDKNKARDEYYCSKN